LCTHYLLYIYLYPGAREKKIKAQQNTNFNPEVNEEFIKKEKGSKKDIPLREIEPRSGRFSALLESGRC
jgi:hypothetical protein